MFYPLFIKDKEETLLCCAFAIIIGVLNIKFQLVGLKATCIARENIARAEKLNISGTI